MSTPNPNNVNVIYHRADFDGHLSGAICKKFLEENQYKVTLIGWDYGDPIPAVSDEEQLYIVDLAVHELMEHRRLTWIDHHKSSIEKYPDRIYGNRLDGVAACRLCWDYFTKSGYTKRRLHEFVDRTVDEPELIRLAGEYDVWDKRDPNAERIQFGLEIYGFHAERCNLEYALASVATMLETGRIAQGYVNQVNRRVCNERSYFLTWHGLNFLACNTAYGNSQFFDRHERLNEADALMMWRWDGRRVVVSLYHAPHRTDLDLSLIATGLGGGGHRGACGFTLDPMSAAFDAFFDGARCSV